MGFVQRCRVKNAAVCAGDKFMREMRSVVER